MWYVAAKKRFRESAHLYYTHSAASEMPTFKREANSKEI